VRKVFSPKLIADVRPSVQKIVDRILDRADADGGIDVVADLAFRLPIEVICDLLGVPRADGDQLHEWAGDVASFQATGYPDPGNAQRAARAIQEVEAYFDEVCAGRRNELGSDLVSIMLEAEEEGSRLTHEELINMCVNLLFAGHETTMSLISNATVALLRDDAERLRLKKDPRMLNSAIEEALRYESPIQRGWRRVSSRVVMHGLELRENDIVFMMIGSANRDERVFVSSETFDIGRDPNRHMAFGHGVHHCLGLHWPGLRHRLRSENCFGDSTV